MNDRLTRLQAAHVRQRRFVGDASHELRGPLRTIRTRLEVGLSHPATTTDWVGLARTVHREGARLERLVDELLLLARTESASAVGGAPRTTRYLRRPGFPQAG
jgi:signal transduction histidine kinase